MSQDDPLTWDERGTAHFHVERALRGTRMPNIPHREFEASMEDLMRMGMRADDAQQLPVPRAEIHPTSLVPPGAGPDPSTLAGGGAGFPGMPRIGNVGDIHSEVTEPGNRYWNRQQMPRALGNPYRAVGKKATPPPLPEELERYRPLVTRLLAPQMFKVLEDFRKCGPWYVQPMTWLAPPITAVCVDVFTTAAGVKLPGVYPPPPTEADCPDVLRIEVPDRWIFVLTEFGNELEDHTAFGDVRFSMQRNDFPIRCYGNFDVQLGRFVTPTEFPSHIVLKHKDVFVLKAQSLSAEQHFAFARIRGWAFAVRTISGDGEYSEFCVE